MTPSSRLILSRFAIALVLAGSTISAFAQSATTTPVGFMKFTPSPSTTGSTRKFTVASFPLQGAAEWTGQVNAEPGTNTLVGKNASWTGFGPGSDGFVTHVVRFTSGSSVGRMYPISQMNNSTTVTV